MPLQNNPYKLTSQVSLAPDPQLASMMEHYKGSGDAVSFSVVFNEVQRRKEVRDAAQSKMSGGPKQKVADQLIQEAKQAQMPAPPQGQPPQGGPPQGGPPQGGPPQGQPPQGGPPQGGPPQEGGPPPDMGMGPQGGPPQEGGPPPDMGMGPQEGGPPQGMADGGYLLPEDTGIAQLPARNLENMAGGGLVSFAYGGDIPGYAGDEGSDINEEEEPEEPRPRLDSRGDYRAEMDKIRADQEKQDRDYKTGREGLGEAYANAEERDKEMTQRYSDEERSVKGQALMNFGLNLMQSRERGLAGIGAAGLAALPQYISGRKELSSLKDKQRDYMQTVAEARRAEKLGLLKDMYNVSAAGTGQRIAQAGVEAQLGQGDRELSSKEYIAGLERSARAGTGLGLDKLASSYLQQADSLAAAARDPKNSADKDSYLAAEKDYRLKGNELIDRIKNNQFVLSTQTSEFMTKKGSELEGAIALLSDPKTKAQGMEQLNVLGSGYPGGGVSGKYLLELVNRSREGGGGGGGASGGAPVGRWEDAPEDE